jgi:hypothetical protein
MVLLSLVIFIVALCSALGAIAASIMGSRAQIDAVLASRGQSTCRTIRMGALYSGFKAV